MQFIDLKAQYHALKAGIDANIQAVVDSAVFIGGPYVKELEEKLASFTGPQALHHVCQRHRRPADRLYGGGRGRGRRGILL